MARLKMNFDIYQTNVINFLKENDCLEKFNKNLFNQKRSWEYLYGKINSFHDTIDKAFVWDATPEGYSYWKSLHLKVKAYKYNPNILKDIWYD